MFRLCRLCAKYTEPTELITLISELEFKLTLCCGWKQSENELQFPKNACNSCVGQLQQSWSFAERVCEAERQLNKIASELNSTNADEPQLHIEEVTSMEIKLEPDICSTELEVLEPNFDVTAFDCPVIESDAESSHSNKSTRKQKKSSKRVTENLQPKSDPFLAALAEKDCLADGTISVNGVAKLEKLFPEMKTMTWNSCQYKCEKCNRSFKSPQNFFAHNRSLHLEAVPTMTFSCFYCDSKHRREYNLTRHIAGEHFPHLKFSDYFWDDAELIKHRNMHKDVKYQCELCDQLFYNRDILYSHIAQSHLKKKWGDPESTKYTCEICNKDFATKWSIKSHMLQHTKKFDFVCDQCGWKFLTKGNLKGHLETTHTNEKPFACTKCDGRFKTKHQLANHSKRHEEFKPLECTICDKRFRQMYNLTVHMRSHNNICPYTCKYCDRKFRHTSSLKTHERTHTSEKPYACNHCDYKSTNWPNLNKHSLRIHSIDLRTKKDS
ncbi:zinc finger protein 84-like isoform X1 [Sitodiplosis mosellana]|uniref:zinc finger protein 84-like isoform X1 n=1 Tax=Sitodiplosis mosellana TaxID=263140 RepID=UPI0024437458|nr:zinc finger protein 84-like isoform X1 [Sitodiplosis mosellana]